MTEEIRKPITFDEAVEIDKRIQVMARNLTFMHRHDVRLADGSISKGPQSVSVSDCQLMLVAMGRAIANILLEEHTCKDRKETLWMVKKILLSASGGEEWWPWIEERMPERFKT